MPGKDNNQTGTQPPPLGELPWNLLPRASWTALAASLWVFYNGAPKAQRAARRRRRIGGTVGYALFIFAALWSIRDVWTAALLTAPFLLGLLLLVYVFAVSRLAVFRRWRAATVWSNCDGTIIATSRRRRPGEWMVANFSAWPVGLDRAGPFLDALCVEADAAHATMTGTAGNRYVYEKFYRPRGFQALDDLKRPRIRRVPRRGAPPSPQQMPPTSARFS